jgi:opacity protein-like surface antigen
VAIMRTFRVGQQAVLGVGLFLAACTLSSCAAAVLAGVAGGAGAGTAVYVEGEDSRVHRANLDQTWTATLDALKQMNIRVEKSDKDALGGTVEAKRADGTEVKIKEEPAEGNSTQVKIRVGVFGDQNASEAIQNSIAGILSS